MKKVEILIIVDASAALASRDLQSNIYLVDTNKYMGSGNEGQAELQTACQDGQLLSWRVVSISPDNEVSIVSFAGQMITDRVCVPQKMGISEDCYWEGQVEAQGQAGTQQYNATLAIDGAQLTFDPYLTITT